MQGCARVAACCDYIKSCIYSYGYIGSPIADCVIALAVWRCIIICVYIRPSIQCWQGHIHWPVISVMLCIVLAEKLTLILLMVNTWPAGKDMVFEHSTIVSYKHKLRPITACQVVEL